MSVGVGPLICNFCGKSQQSVKRVMSGPNGACICDECVRLAVEVLEVDMADPAEAMGKIELFSRGWRAHRGGEGAEPDVVALEAYLGYAHYLVEQLDALVVGIKESSAPGQ